jgi:alanyl-tRNA synthetase
MRNVERIRGRVRIEFVCGGRALRLARKDFELLTNAAKVLTTAVDDLPSTVSTMRERLLDAEKDRSRMTLDLARAQGTALFSQTVPGEDGIRRLRLDEAKIDDAARAKVQAFVSAGRALGLVVAPGALLVACSPDSGIDAGKIVKTSMPRGGGSAAVAQGSVTDPAQVAAVASALGLGNQ